MQQILRSLGGVSMRRSTQLVSRRLASTSGEWAPPHVNRMHKILGTVCETTMWLWIFWRAKHDWREFLGLEHPWEGHH
ncbi:uncharacterized protein [Blastocystis hominis]|uniref:Uncharacterized protein n=1 Tax=Blastocystis hominis TaxID=12968 RepID=D8LYG7_BLAHO|nr:uncharacterized protein [Blastocystis hominis]CBK20622.2 unnamed protein product [Blastocystis hominis]|eukprot:XP_012894670.1 uncharacterized protein [Blastocystis hominis]